MQGEKSAADSTSSSFAENQMETIEDLLKQQKELGAKCKEFTAKQRESEAKKGEIEAILFKRQIAMDMELNELKTAHANLLEQQQNTLAELKAANQDNKELNEKIATLNAENLRLKAQIDELKKQITNFENSIDTERSQKNKRIAELSTNLQNVKSREQKWHKINVSMEKDMETLQQELEEHKQYKDKAEYAISMLNNNYEQKTTQYDHLATHFQQILDQRVNEKAAEFQQNLNSYINKMDKNFDNSLKEMNAGYEKKLAKQEEMNIKLMEQRTTLKIELANATKKAKIAEQSHLADLEECQQLAEKISSRCGTIATKQNNKLMRNLGIISNSSNINNAASSMATAGELQQNEQNNLENGKNTENVCVNENLVAAAAANQTTFPIVNSPRNVIKRTVPLVGGMNGCGSTNEGGDLAENQQMAKKNRRE